MLISGASRMFGFTRSLRLIKLGCIAVISVLAAYMLIASKVYLNSMVPLRFPSYIWLNLTSSVEETNSTLSSSTPFHASSTTATPATTTIADSELRTLASRNGLMYPPTAQQRFLLGFLNARKFLLAKQPLASSTSLRAWHDFLVRPLGTPSLPKVLVVSASFANRSFGPITRPHVEQYAKSNNYGFTYFTNSLNDSYNRMWQKILFLQFAMADASKPDVIFWIDDDAVITNASVRIENFLELLAPKELTFVVTQDTSFAPYCLFNAGVLIFRNNALMTEYFERVLRSYDEIPYYQSHYNWEQDVMNLILLEMPELYQHTLLLTQCLQQSFDASWQPGDFIMHIPGLGTDQKLASIKFLLENAVESWANFPRHRNAGVWRCDRN